MKILWGRGSINSLNLHFKNKNLENEFNKKRWEKVRGAQKIYLIFILTLSVYLFLLVLLKSSNMELIHIPISVAVLLIIFTVTVCGSNRFFLSDLIISLANSAVTIAFVETIRNSSQSNYLQGSLASISFGLIATSFFKASLNYFYSMLNQIFFLIYSTARLFPRFSEDEWLMWPFFVLGSLMLVFNYFFDEKIEREKFVEYKENLKRQRIWKFILNEVYPQSTFLINSDDFLEINEGPVPPSGFHHNKGPSLLKKLSTYFFEKDRPVRKFSINRLQSKNSGGSLKATYPNKSSSDLPKEDFSSKEDYSLDLDYSPSKVSKQKLRVNTAEDMYNFLSNIEVKNIILPSGFEPRRMNSMKKLSEVIEYLFKDSGSGPRLTLQNFNSGMRSPAGELNSADFKQINFRIKDFYERKKKIEHKSILIKGTLTCPNDQVPGEMVKIPVNLKLCKFKWDKKPWVIIFFQDISDYEENKYLKEVDKMKDKLLASVTHDLRTPLNMVLVMIDNARASNTKLLLEESLNFAEVNAKLLSNLISDILDFSLFKENKLRLVFSHFSLDSVLKEVSKLLLFQAEQKKIEYVITNKSTKSFLYTDSQRLKQILINLLTNSIKFTQQGSIKVKVKEYFAQNLLKFTVKDTGRGIKQENIKHLFKPFNTFDTEDGLNKTGIGLGLYICKNICSMLGPFDQLFVYSEWLKGTSIEFFLYRDMNSRKIKIKDIPSEFAENRDYSALLTKFTEVIDEERINVSADLSDFHMKGRDMSEMRTSIMNNIRTFDFLCEKNPFVSESPRQLQVGGASDCHNLSAKRRLNVLIVDDNVFNLIILENYLKKLEDLFEIHILKAYNGREVVELFGSHNRIEADKQKGDSEHIHIILMDCEMPDINGFEASAIIREKILTGGFQESIIAACTAYSREEDRERCLDAGMKHFLIKPISEQEIRNLFLEFF